MVTIEYLDDERTKLWVQVNSLKAELSAIEGRLINSTKSTAESVEKKLGELRKVIEEVKSIADAKTPEDVQTARRAAQDIVKLKDDVQNLVAETSDAKDSLASAKKAFKQIEARDSASAQKVAEVDANAKKIVDMVSSVNELVSKINQSKVGVDNLMEKITTASATATPQAQEIANLKAKASSEFSDISAIKQKVTELQTQLIQLQEEYDKRLEEANKTFSEIVVDGQGKLSKLFGENELRLKDLTNQINDLLPGATSVALASAFDSRKKAVEKFKWVWATLLILSSLSIVCFGCWFLSKPTLPDTVSSLPIRLVIIAGLVLIEEFARRNFNVATRLAESYAYKEAISKSYLGFKTEMTGVVMPEMEPGNQTQCVSVLVKTFLDKLGEEPGKRVFDKEKRTFGLLNTIAQLSAKDSQEGESIEKAKIVANAVSAFTRISWPLVVLISILAITGCFIAYIIVK